MRQRELLIAWAGAQEGKRGKKIEKHAHGYTGGRAEMQAQAFVCVTECE